jgi:hypothetical protein
MKHLMKKVGESKRPLTWKELDDLVKELQGLEGCKEYLENIRSHRIPGVDWPLTRKACIERGRAIARQRGLVVASLLAMTGVFTFCQESLLGAAELANDSEFQRILRNLLHAMASYDPMNPESHKAIMALAIEENGPSIYSKLIDRGMVKLAEQWKEAFLDGMREALDFAQELEKAPFEPEEDEEELP